ncbi:MAG TPA: hypothetical protein VMH90_03540 [Thermoplasmata archaeon]|nr:hypothetical protein [Thermoplasmata archaeon]
MNRGDLGLLALFPLLVYTSYAAAASVATLSSAATLGLLTALVPALGLVRRDLGAVTWVPGTFLGITVFVTSGISVNDYPGVFGDLLGGWALGAPIFIGLGAVYARDSPGTRIFLVVLAFLAGAAALSAVAVGPFGTADGFGLVFAQLPRLQGSALGVVLTGGAPGVIPMFRGITGAYLPLALLGAAGTLGGLLGVDPSETPESLGFEEPEPHVPEGTYRSLFPEGRLRLGEATPAENPPAADLPSLVSVGAAVLVALTALVLAARDPDHLLPLTAGVVIVLLAATLALSYTSRPPTKPAPRALPETPAPTPVAAPAERL